MPKPFLDEDRELVWETLRTHADHLRAESALQALDRIFDRYDEALKEQEFYEIECSAARQEVDDAQADAKALREAGRRWLSETSPGQHTNTAVGRHMMMVAIGDES